MDTHDCFKIQEMKMSIKENWRWRQSHFKFDIAELLDKAQESIIEVQQKMDGLTAVNIIPTLELDTATCGRTIHVMNSNKCTNTLSW